MSEHYTLKYASLLAAMVIGANLAHAAVTADEAKKLGTSLTSFGAEKAGNSDGSIPEYTGGLKSIAGHDPKTSRAYPDPFASEKPQYSIDPRNMAKYEALLTEGAKAMLKKYPSYRMDVYSTQRTARYPDWIAENSVKNATTVSLAGEVQGDALKGAAADGMPYAGVPFPIPKNGYEVMWNHKMRVSAPVVHIMSNAALVDSNGGVTPLPRADQYNLSPWWDKSGELRKKTFNATMGFSTELVTPPSQAGTYFLNYYLPSAEENGQKIWFYSPGQRRVRRAPEFAYDIPISSYGGVMFWDELNGFVGRLDRFNFTLVGKKEMIVPYNDFVLTNNAPIAKVATKGHVNPDTVRWEKRRVWVVEADRKDGARHAYKKRRFYVEEDCWCIVANEAYDDSNNLWRVGFVYTFPTYDTGGVSNHVWTYNDLNKGNYFVINLAGPDEGSFFHSYSSSEGLPFPTTAEGVQSRGVR